MGEVVTVIGADRFDEDGNLVAESMVVQIPGCVVAPDGDGVIDGPDISGDTTRLKVIAPAGVHVAVDDVVRIRGELFRVVFVPFDWSVGRKPKLGSHRPRTVFVVERGEG